MAKYKFTEKSNQVKIKCKLASSESVNEREFMMLSQSTIQGFMCPVEESDHSISFIGACGKPLKKFLKHRVTKEQFFMIIAHLLEAVKMAGYLGLNLGNMLLDTEHIVIDDTNGSMYFIYQPFVGVPFNKGLGQGILDIFNGTGFNTKEDKAVADAFINYIHTLQPINIPAIENYILGVAPQTYMYVRRMQFDNTDQQIQINDLSQTAPNGYNVQKSPKGLMEPRLSSYEPQRRMGAESVPPMMNPQPPMEQQQYAPQPPVNEQPPYIQPPMEQQQYAPQPPVNEQPPYVQPPMEQQQYAPQPPVNEQPPYVQPPMEQQQYAPQPPVNEQPPYVQPPVEQQQYAPQPPVNEQPPYVQPEIQPVPAPVQEVKPAEQPKPVEPVAPVQEVQPVEQPKPVEPAAPVQEVQPVEQPKPVEPAAPVQEVKPVEQPKPVEPVAPVQEVKPVEQPKPVEPAAPVQAVQPVEQPKPVEPAAPVQEVKPVEQPKPVEPAAPVQEVKPVEQPKPVEPAASVQEVKPVEQPKPVEPAAPVQEVKPVEQPKPVEPAAPAAPAPVQNAAPVQNVPPAKGGSIFQYIDPPEQPVQESRSYPSGQMYDRDYSQEEEVYGSSFDAPTVLLHENYVESFPRIVRQNTGEEAVVDRPYFKIGKEKNKVDFCVKGNNTVSRVHATIVERDGRYYLWDNNSTNKTFLNGSPIPPMVDIEIRSGDVFRLSNENFRFLS